MIESLTYFMKGFIMFICLLFGAIIRYFVFIVVVRCCSPPLFYVSVYGVLLLFLAYVYFLKDYIMFKFLFYFVCAVYWLVWYLLRIIFWIIFDTSELSKTHVAIAARIVWLYDLDYQEVGLESKRMNPQDR